MRIVLLGAAAALLGLGSCATAPKQATANHDAVGGGGDLPIPVALPLHSEVALNLICSDVVVPPSLLLEVRNVGTKVIFPDGRLAVTSRVSRGEATLNIQRTSGDHVTFNCRVRMPCSHCPRPPLSRA